MRFRTVLLFLCLFVGILPIFGQHTPWFIRFSTTDGLPSNNLGPMANDPDGFLWVGTRNGLARFDGQRFVPFNNLQPGMALPNQNVSSLVADAGGNLWVQYTEQLFRVSTATFQVEALSENYTPQCVDATGKMYFIGNGELSIFRESTRDFAAIEVPGAQLDEKVLLVCTGKNNRLLVLTNRHLYCFDPQNHTAYALRALDSVKGILTMASDEKGNLWISRWTSAEHGVIYCDPYADKVLRMFSKDQDGFSDTDLNGITPDGDNVWFATNTGGLCRYVVSENRVFHYGAMPEKPGHFWNDQTARCHIDAYGNLWVSSPVFLYKCPVRFPSTALLRPEPQQSNSLIAPHCTNILPIEDDQMVLGTQDGLSVYHRKTGRFFNVRLPNYSEYNNQITGCAKAADGSFWASSWTGLYRVDARTGRVLSWFITHTNSKISPPASARRFDVGAIRRMCADRNGILWVANFGNQVACLDQKSSRPDLVPVRRIVSDSFSLRDRAEAFLDWTARYFLLGTLDGLVRLDRTTQRFEVCPLVFPDATHPTKIESLARSNNGDILCIANGKPYRVRWGDTKAEAQALEMPKDVSQAHHIIEDRLGKIWITTENGLVKYDPDTKNSLFYDSHHYLNDNLLLLRPTVAPAQDGDGNLYFGGSRGVSVLRPEDFAIREQQGPPVKIIDLSINGQRAELDSAIHRIKTVHLSYAQNNLAFTFAALHSTVPQCNTFAYRFTGDKWVELGTQNSVNFSRLTPGHYVLEVKAANSDGVWNETGTSLRIIIAPPWWRSWTAYFVYAALLGYALFAYLKFRENRLQIAYQLDTERKEAERLQELDHFKSRFFANISHEFRTPLTVIMGMAERWITERENKEEKRDSTADMSATQDATERSAQSATMQAMKMIRRNGQNLLRLINQILDLAKMEEGKLQLRPEQADMVAFSRYVAESLHSLSDMKGISLHFEATTEALWMDFDLEKMQSIFFNLLSNALKFTPKGGHVYLKISRAEQGDRPMCRIEVRDTGVGISADKMARIFDRFFRIEQPATRQIEGVGIGLAFTRELVRLMEGEIRVESAPEEGSTFEILLPVTREQPVRATAEALSALSVREMQPWSALPEPREPFYSNAEVVRTSRTDPEEARPTILLVEDNEDVRHYLVTCVSSRYQVLQAHNGQEGIEMALEHTPDLIVSDVMMPEKDGFELCQTLKSDERSSHIPIVLLTAKASVESRIAGLSRGADAYLSKPFHHEELLLTLNNLLQTRQMMQEWLRASWLRTQAAPQPTPPNSALAPETRAALEAEDVFVQKIRRYVEDHLSNPNLSVEELSRAMTMSYQNLHRKMTALTNRSPVQFVRTVRLQKALSLLQNTRQPIGDIAFLVGFEDPKYFSRVFTEEFGKPPSAMRS